MRHLQQKRVTPYISSELHVSKDPRYPSHLREIPDSQSGHKITRSSRNLRGLGYLEYLGGLGYLGDLGFLEKCSSLDNTVLCFSRSLLLSHQEKDLLAGSRQSFFRYDTNYHTLQEYLRFWNTLHRLYGVISKEGLARRHTNPFGTTITTILKDKYFAAHAYSVMQQSTVSLMDGFMADISWFYWGFYLQWLLVIEMRGEICAVSCHSPVLSCQLQGIIC